MSIEPVREPIPERWRRLSATEVPIDGECMLLAARGPQRVEFHHDEPGAYTRVSSMNLLAGMARGKSHRARITRYSVNQPSAMRPSEASEHGVDDRRSIRSRLSKTNSTEGINFDRLRGEKAAEISRLWLSWRAIGVIRSLCIVSAFFLCIVFPAQLAFDGPVTFDQQPGWASLYLAIDIFLWLEMAARFGSPGYQLGRPVYSHKSIALHYLTGHIDGVVVDILARFPWDAVRGADGFSYGYLARLVVLRRCLVVLTTRPRGSPRFLQPGLRLLLLVGNSLIALHWYACVLFLTSRHMTDPDSWLQVNPWRTWPMWARYVRSFDRALLIMVGEGYHGTTHAEIAISCVGLLIGTAFIAYFTSTLVSIVTSLNQAEEAAHQKIERVGEYLRNSHLPSELQARVREHLQTVLLDKKLVLDPDHLLREVSFPLRAEVALHRCHPLLMSPTFVTLLVDEGGLLDAHFIKLLVTKLQLAVFAPADYVVEEGECGQEIFFLAAGLLIVSKNGRNLTILYPGACFGEIALLIPSARRAANIVAHSFSEAQYLTRDDLFFCLRDFPALKTRITRLAQQRLDDLNSTAAQSTAQRKGSSHRDGSAGSDENVVPEATEQGGQIKPVTISRFAVAVKQAQVQDTRSKGLRELKGMERTGSADGVTPNRWNVRWGSISAAALSKFGSLSPSSSRHASIYPSAPSLSDLEPRSRARPSSAKARLESQAVTDQNLNGDEPPTSSPPDCLSDSADASCPTSSAAASACQQPDVVATHDNEGQPPAASE